MPLVVVSERGRAQTIRMSSLGALCGWGCKHGQAVPQDGDTAPAS